MAGPLTPGLLNEIATKARQGRAAAVTGAQVKPERSTSNAEQLAAVANALTGPVQSRSSSLNRSWSFTLPTAAFVATDYTVGLWHCNEGSGGSAGDSSDNDNDLTLTDVAWTTGKFSNGLSFNGVSSVASATLSSTEPIRRFLYFAAWVNLTGGGPIFQWEDVLEVYQWEGSLMAQVGDQTYEGPAIPMGEWVLVHVQFFAGTVFIGVGDVIYSFAHTDNQLTIPAWEVTFGKRDTDYYDGLMDEMRLEANVEVQEDWGKRLYRAQESSVLYCTFDLGSGDIERHQDFFGPTVALSNLTWQTGYLGSAARFNGTTGYAIFMPGAALTPAELSIEMVVKFSSVAPCSLIDQTGGLNLSFTGTAIRAAIEGVSEADADIAAWVPEADTWYIITLVYTGSEKQFWVNGQKRGVIAATGTASIPATAIYLGRTVAGADYFAGDLDFLHIAACLLRPQVRPIHRWIAGAHGFGANEDWVVMAD